MMRSSMLVREINDNDNSMSECVLPSVDEHVEEEAPELVLFVRSVDKKACDGL